MPPATERIVHINAVLHHFFGAANTIGIRSTSGGIGKNDDSAKAKTAKAYVL